jgi:shikimate 5-dehydrogenase
VPEPKTFLSLITGSFAMPAAENPTVAMIEAAYEHHNINARYLNCEVAPEALGDAVRGACAKSFVLFGAGGAARAIAVETALAGALQPKIRSWEIVPVLFVVLENRYVSP